MADYLHGGEDGQRHVQLSQSDIVLALSSGTDRAKDAADFLLAPPQRTTREGSSCGALST